MENKDEKEVDYLLQILDDELMYHRFIAQLKRSRDISKSIWYTMRDRDTDRAIYSAINDGIIPKRV